MNFVELILNGLFVGMGTVVGSFLGTRLIIHRLEKIVEKIKKGE